MMLVRVAMLGALLVGAVACDRAPEVGSQESPRRSRAEQNHSTRALAPSVAERAVVHAIAWPDRAMIDAGARQLFGTDHQRILDLSGVPVLAPRDARFFARATVVARAHWFTIALKDAAYADELASGPDGRPVVDERGGVSVFVQGNRTARRVPGLATASGRHRVRGRPAWITQSESIWSATWEEHGATYVVDLECSRPVDSRCATSDVLIEVVESLAFVGGAGPVVASEPRDALAPPEHPADLPLREVDR